MTDESNELIIDSERIRMIEYVNVRINEVTSAVHTDELFEELNIILRNIANA